MRFTDGECPVITMNAEITSTWVLVGGSAFVWVIGHMMCSRRIRRDGTPSKLGRLVEFVGFVALCTGLYAGLFGPATIGDTTYPAFEFSQKIRRSSEEALAYSRSKLEITKGPASGWRGGSKTALQYVVNNTGNREIYKMTLRFRTKNKTTVDLVLKGPFPVGRTSRAVLEIPPDVDRVYFEDGPVNLHDIVGANF